MIDGCVEMPDDRMPSAPLFYWRAPESLATVVVHFGGWSRRIWRLTACDLICSLLSERQVAAGDDEGTVL